MEQAERNERKKQLIAQGALHRAALRAERHATSQALQPRTLASGVLQQVMALGLGMLRDKTSASSAEGIAGQRTADTPDASGAMLAALASALPGALPAALPLLIRTATTLVPALVRLGRAAGLRLDRKTLLRGALIAGAAAAVTAVVVVRKKKAAARISSLHAEDSVIAMSDDVDSPH